MKACLQDNLCAVHIMMGVVKQEASRASETRQVQSTHCVNQFVAKLNLPDRPFMSASPMMQIESGDFRSYAIELLNQRVKITL